MVDYMKRNLINIKRLIEFDFLLCKKTIDNLDDDFFGVFMAQRGLEKIYRNKVINSEEKESLIDRLQEVMPNHKDDIANTYRFVETFIPIGEKIISKISDIIKLEFSNSITIFYYCLGKYVEENPDMIGLAKNVLVFWGRKLLNDDTILIKHQLSISLDSIYFKKKKYIELIYKEAIKYGVLIEKYDDICFGFEYIKNITTIGNKPEIMLKFVDPKFEFGLHCGSEFHQSITRKRYEEEPGEIESFYKCVICKYCTFFNVPEEQKELSFEVLHRQFSNRNQTDMFYFFTGDFQSYILSIVTYIYVRLLILICCTDKTMEFVEEKEIKKAIFGNEKISDSDFQSCYRLVVSNKIMTESFQICNGGILIGRWQYDNNLNIIELSKNISLNSKNERIAGVSTNRFGKETYEKLVRNMLEDNNWCIVPKSIRIKLQAAYRTDVDLIAYNSGIVIVGQVKLANTGRSKYELWKARDSINKGVNQINITLAKFEEDPNLLYSILKRFGLCQRKDNIIKIIPIIITSSSYFIGDIENSHIPIISWDMFCQIVHSINIYNKLFDIDDYLYNLCSVYDFGYSKKVIISEIEQPEYNIKYEEFEEWS